MTARGEARYVASSYSWGGVGDVDEMEYERDTEAKNEMGIQSFDWTIYRDWAIKLYLKGMKTSEETVCLLYQRCPAVTLAQILRCIEDLELGPPASLAYIWIDAICIDQESYYDDPYNSRADDVWQYNSQDMHLQMPLFKEGLVVAPLLGLCVHGRLKLFTRGASINHCFDFQYQDEFSDDGGAGPAIGSIPNCCRSTRILNSRSSQSLKGTGHWFLDSQEYVEWRNQASNLLWVSGKPGAGKSVLMSTVIHDLQVNRRDGELVAYFFADGYYQGTGTASAILRAMLGQLLSNSTGDLLRDLKPLLKDIIAAGIHLSLTRMEFFVSKIRHTLRPGETLYLLLDGLDEVNQSPYEQEILLKLIEHASHYDPNHRIKCFVSSRRSFFGENFPKGALRVDLDAHPFTRRDMSLYVKDSLKNAKRAYSSRDVEDLAEQLVNSASGSFLVLRLILEANLWSTEESNPGLGHFPSNWENTNAHSLSDVYRQMLGGIDDSNKEAALSMLRWVTYVARPLDSDELLDALYEQCGIKVKKEEIISISAGLLSISGTQILFTHLSVREFLESQLSSKWEEISDEANEMIAHACLKLLQPENLLQSLRLPTRKSPGTNKSLRYHQSILPYAQTYWIYHYRRAERRSSYLAGFLHDFLEESLLKDSENIDSNNEGEVQAPGRIADFLDGLHVSNCFNSLDLVNTALRVGARFGFSKLVKLELDMGANPNMISGPERQTALSWAAKCGHLDIVQLLLQRGADPNLTSGSGKTPLIYAMINGHFDVLDVLMTFPTNTLQRNQFPSLAALGDDAIPISQNDFQELSLTVLISSSCTVCEEIRVSWRISAVARIRDGRSNCPVDDENELLPPILVSGESLPRSELDISFNVQGLDQQHSPSTTVRWFPGVQMYRVLGTVAKRGIEDVRKLLITAGNDRNSLDRIVSVSKLVSQLRVS